MDNSKYTVQIIEDESGEIVKETKPMDNRQAEKVEAGMSINLNWERYSLKIKKVSQ